VDERPILSTVILNYRHAELTNRCVTQLIDAAETAALSLQVIVVDNSAPLTADSLRAQLTPHVQLIENSVNQGFARANNQGIREAAGDFILLLNNDAFATAESLAGGIEYLHNDPSVGIWAPQLCTEDGTTQISCARFPSLLGLAGEYLLRKNFDRYPRGFHATQPVKVETVTGAFFLLSRNVLETVGLLDEAYYFNVEDVDYCRRVRSKGFSIVYDPRYKVLHLGSASQDTAPWFRDHHLHHNRKLYFYKNQGLLSGYAAHLIIELGVMLRRTKWWIGQKYQQYLTR
jgi:GT2 family glycosyltransferase